MDAIRQFIDVKNHTFQVTLPESFNAQRVEVIILPSQEEDYTLTDEQKKLLDERLNEPKTNFKPVRESLSQLRGKYGL